MAAVRKRGRPRKELIFAPSNILDGTIINMHYLAEFERIKSKWEREGLSVPPFGVVFKEIDASFRYLRKESAVRRAYERFFGNRDWLTSHCYHPSAVRLFDINADYIPLIAQLTNLCSGLKFISTMATDGEANTISCCMIRAQGKWQSNGNPTKKFPTSSEMIQSWFSENNFLGYARSLIAEQNSHRPIGAPRINHFPVRAVPSDIFVTLYRQTGDSSSMRTHTDEVKYATTLFCLQQDPAEHACLFVQPTRNSPLSEFVERPYQVSQCLVMSPFVPHCVRKPIRGDRMVLVCFW